MPVQIPTRFVPSTIIERGLRLSAAKFHSVFISLRAIFHAGLLFAELVEIGDFAHAREFATALQDKKGVANRGHPFAFLSSEKNQPFGPIICSGRTTASNVASSTKPSAIASSFNVVPFLCAVLATLVALS